MANAIGCVGCQTLLPVPTGALTPAFGFCVLCFERVFHVEVNGPTLFEVEFEVENYELVTSEGYGVWCSHERFMGTEAEANETALERSRKTGESTRVVRKFKQVLRTFEAAEEVKYGD